MKFVFLQILCLWYGTVFARDQGCNEGCDSGCMDQWNSAMTEWHKLSEQADQDMEMYRNAMKHYYKGINDFFF